MSFDFDTAYTYRANKQPWPAGWPADQIHLFSPEDGEGIHALLVDLVQSAQHSLVLNLYGYDDRDIDAALRAKAGSPDIYFQASLDKTQAAGKSEAELLALWPHDAMGTSIAIGTSSKHAISHLKVLIVDGLYVVTGSTNWSLGGETKQDNQLVVHRSAVVAAAYRTKLDIDHDFMLAQMRGTSKKEVA